MYSNHVSRYLTFSQSMMINVGVLNNILTLEIIGVHFYKQCLHVVLLATRNAPAKGIVKVMSMKEYNVTVSCIIPSVERFTVIQYEAKLMDLVTKNVQTLLSNTSFIKATKLVLNRDYSIRVRAKNTAGYGKFSTAQKFRTLSVVGM